MYLEATRESLNAIFWDSTHQSFSSTFLNDPVNLTNILLHLPRYNYHSDLARADAEVQASLHGYPPAE